MASIDSGDERSNSAPRRIEVAYVSRAHGIRGEVLAVPIVDGSTTLAEVDVIWIGGQRHVLVRARPVPDGFLLALEGVGDRDVAAALRGQTIEVERDDLLLEEDDVLLADLVGCKVVTADGVGWGEVAAIELGPQDRLVIRDLVAGIERLLPVVDAFIADIDLEAGVITITPPDGMPEDPLPGGPARSAAAPDSAADADDAPGDDAADADGADRPDDEDDAP